MDTCPKCRSNRMRRSRSKTFFERLRRDFSNKRLFRCDACGWRGWGIETEKPLAPADAREPVGPSPDFDAIDMAMTDPGAKQNADTKT